MNIRTIKIPAGLWLLLFAGLFLSGCASRQAADASFALGDYDENMAAARSAMTPEERFAYDYRSAAMARMREENVPLSNVHLVEKAKTAIGTPYVRGGTSRNGFDCSGFVQWAYKSVGVTLPRTAREQSVLGTPIDSDEMVAGDIVAFRHPRRGYHTGIYIGDGKFIHSPRRGKSVEITSLSDPYFSSTFLGARRVSLSESDAEAAQKLLALHESRSRNRSIADVSGPSRRMTAAKASSSKKAAFAQGKKKRSTVAQSRKSGQKNVAAKKNGRERSVSRTASKSSVKSASVDSRKKAAEQKRAVRQKASTTGKKTVAQSRDTEKKSAVGQKSGGKRRVAATSGASVKKASAVSQKKTAQEKKRPSKPLAHTSASSVRTL